MPAPRASRAVLTPWRRELRLLERDRGRLAMIFLIPAAFLAVPLLTSQGWSWTSASPARVAMLIFSTLVYLAASGPLLHMQGEQRAFWILETVPVSLGRLFALKALVWAGLFVLMAGSAFVVLSGAAGFSPSLTLPTFVLLVAGCVGLAFLAIGLGASVVDFTEPARPSLGPATFYAFLFVAGLFNVALGESASLGEGRSASVVLRGAALFALATAATWQTGVARARWAYDPDEVRRREPRLSEGALLAMVAFLAPLAARSLPAKVAPTFVGVTDGLVLAFGGHLLFRWRHATTWRRGGVWSVPVAALLGLASGYLGLFGNSVAVTDGPDRLLHGLFVMLAAAAREVCLRGVVQGAVEHSLRQAHPAPTVGVLPLLGGAAASVILQLLLTQQLDPSAILVGVACAGLRAGTGRVGAALGFGLGGMVGPLV